MAEVGQEFMGERDVQGLYSRWEEVRGVTVDEILGYEGGLQSIKEKMVEKEGLHKVGGV